MLRGQLKRQVLRVETMTLSEASYTVHAGKANYNFFFLRQQITQYQDHFTATDSHQWNKYFLDDNVFSV